MGHLKFHLREAVCSLLWGLGLPVSERAIRIWRFWPWDQSKAAYPFPIAEDEPRGRFASLSPGPFLHSLHFSDSGSPRADTGRGFLAVWDVFVPFFFNIYLFLFLWLRRVLAAAGKLLVVACGIQFPDQGWNPGPLHWECSLSHWVTREVPGMCFWAR